MGTAERIFDLNLNDEATIPDRLLLKGLLSSGLSTLQVNEETHDLKLSEETESLLKDKNPRQLSEFFRRNLKPLPGTSRPNLESLPGTFRLLQLWEGRVTHVSKDEFIAIISDRTDPSLNDEQVTLSIEEVTEDDVPLIKPGAVFYWSIGYADHPGRPRVRESRIRFRRLPGWTKTELDRAKETANNLSAYFNPDRA